MLGNQKHIEEEIGEDAWKGDGSTQKASSRTHISGKHRIFLDDYIICEQFRGCPESINCGGSRPHPKDACDPCPRKNYTGCVPVMIFEDQEKSFLLELIKFMEKEFPTNTDRLMRERIANRALTLKLTAIDKEG